MKTAATIWLAIVFAAAVLLTFELVRGVALQTDLLALLPQEERDPFIQQAKHRATQILDQRIVLLVGDANAAQAVAGGSALAAVLSNSGLTTSVDYRLRQDRLKALGALYSPYRFGLLTEADRERLEHGRGVEILDRALASVYGPGSITDLTLLRRDPFMLLPTFLLALPLPQSHLSVENGVLTIRDQGKTWVLVTALLNRNVYAMDFQDRFTALLDRAEWSLRTHIPDVEILRAGAIFYAHAGATTVNRETQLLSIVSLLGTVLLIVAVFHALRPLWLTLLAIAVGVLCAFAATFWLFGGLHVAALLFGVSLIGIAIDYCLQYVSSRFDTGTPMERLRRVLPGITLGVTTTLIGYATLLLAPFPGLHQVAVFSAVGLVASFLTVVLWLPLLDSGEMLRHGGRMLAAGHRLWIFWENARYRLWRRLFTGGCAVLALAGTTRFTIDDDVRHQQTLSADVRVQESAIRRLTGTSGGTEFLLVQGANEEGVLRAEEALSGVLTTAKRDGALGDFQSFARFVPSQARQRADRDLVQDRLMAPFLGRFDRQLGITDGDVVTNEAPGFLVPSAIDAQSPLAFLSNLVIADGPTGTSHLVLLDGVARGNEVRRAAESVPGVRYVDSTADVTRLLGDYRRRAVVLIAISVTLMFPLLLWRYGLTGALCVSLPSLAAVVLAPLFVAVVGLPFNFFSAMALVFVLSIGFDYAVFCRESRPERRAATMLGIWLAMVTTLLSFGLLGVSKVQAVRAFGATLTVGTLLAFAFAPVAASLMPAPVDRSTVARGRF